MLSSLSFLFLKSLSSGLTARQSSWSSLRPERLEANAAERGGRPDETHCRGERERGRGFFLFVVVVVVVDLSLVVSQRRVAVVRPQRASNRTQHSWSPRAQRDSRAGLSFLKRE